MTRYEQMELDLTTEIEELETEIKERTEYIEKNATCEFSLPNYREITYIMERKCNNLKRALEYIQFDVRAGSKEEQKKREEEAKKEQAQAITNDLIQQLSIGELKELNHVTPQDVRQAVETVAANFETYHPTAEVLEMIARKIECVITIQLK